MKSGKRRNLLKVNSVAGRKGRRKEGKKEGLKLGEERKGREIALRMLKRDIPIAEIADLTGLPITQIQSLHN
jgi:predicted transposase YdaD